MIKRWVREMGYERMKQYEASLWDRGHKESPKFTKKLGVLCDFFVIFVLKT